MLANIYFIMFSSIWFTILLLGTEKVCGFVVVSSPSSNPGTRIRNHRYGPPFSLKPKNSSSTSINNQLQETWETHNGILNIPGAISSELSDALFDYITDQKIQAWLASSTVFHSTRNGDANAEQQQATLRKRELFGHRHKMSKYACDLQLSLLRGGYASDFGKSETVSVGERHVLAEAMRELLSGDESSSSLMQWMEYLVTKEGEICELAAWVTEPGYEGREAYSSVAFDDMEGSDYGLGPVYTLIVALQDIHEDMGCVNFVRGAQLEKTTEVTELTTHSSLGCTLRKGDAVLYDARILRSEGINHATLGSTCALLQLSFCNPNFNKDSTGYTYPGSLRPGYRGAMNLGDLEKVLLLDINAAKDGKDIFEAYGDGIQKEFHNTNSADEQADG